MPVLKVKNNGEWQDTFGISSLFFPGDDICDLPTKSRTEGGDADTLDGKHASEFALASDVSELKNKVGDTSVSDQIASAIPTSLKNPSALVVNGIEYDGSTPVDITNQINTLIDAKLGVIEHGSY
jgi:hypothetical protein